MRADRRGCGQGRDKVGNLFEKLEEYAEGGIYPYHMPGHKRQSIGKLPDMVCKYDITEIEGFDNLHQPESILLAMQQKAARLYGAEESFYLVNGSTGGILSAVSCALPVGGHILMARNCHKSAYHAAYMRKLNISYLYPPLLEEFDIYDAVPSEDIEEALERESGIGAVLIVSPTYEGRISDVRAIAEVVHRKGIPLIVDEAHGAHLGLTTGTCNSCQAGADLVIHSVHKTLPALTQSALLHVNGRLVNRSLLKRFLHIYQTSSPSYLLMASIDNALQYMEEEGNEAFERFQSLYEEMMHALRKCRYLKFLPPNEKKQDVGKLLISVKGSGYTGKQIYDILLLQYGLQLEMASATYALAMFTVSDTEEAYKRMTDALLQIDREMEGRGKKKNLECERKEEKEGREREGKEEKEGREREGKEEKEERGRKREGKEEKEGRGGKREGKEEEEGREGEEREKEGKEVKEEEEGKEKEEEKKKEKKMSYINNGSESLPLAEAWDRGVEKAPLEESIGRYAGEFVNLYPPGVPLLVPGEQITEELYEDILEKVTEGLTVQGIEKQEHGQNTGGQMEGKTGLYIYVVEDSGKTCKNSDIMSIS